MNRVFKKFTLPTTMVTASLLGLFACTQASTGELNYVKKDAPSPGAAAKIFGETVSEADLENNNIRVYQKRLEVFQTLRREVDERVRKKVFEELAAKAKMSVDEYMNKEMEVAKKKINDKAVMDFLKDRIDDPSQAPQHIKDQVKGILHLQNIVADYTKKNPVEFYLKRPAAPELNINLANSPVAGDKNSNVAVVIYSDFQCPYCGKANEKVVKELKKKYGKKIRIAFKHFPLSIHPEAKPASMASMCVFDQNPDKFWAFHDMLFANQRNLAEADLNAYAKKIGGIDMAKYDECVKSKKNEAIVQADFEEGARLGVNSTPSFFVNNQPVLGARPIEEFSEIIDEELAKGKK